MVYRLGDDKVNKEIEELLNNIKDKYSYEPYDMTGKVYTTISYEEGQLLVSYIEQLEKEIERQSKAQVILDNEITEANESVTWWQNRYNAVERDKKQLENNKNKAIEYFKFENPEIFKNPKYSNHLWTIDGLTIKRFINILKGDSDD